MKRLLLFLLVISGIVLPQKFYNWESKTLPKSVQGFITSGNSKVLAAVFGSPRDKYYKSTNQGNSWQELPDFYVEPENLLYENYGRIFYLKTNSTPTYELYYTDNLGVSSSLSQTDQTKYPEKLFGTGWKLFLKYQSDNNLYISHNNGATWEFFLEIGPLFRKFRISPSGKYYLFERGKLKVSTDSGITWSEVNAGFTPYDFELKGEIIFLINEFTLAASEDGGASWETEDRDFGTIRFNMGKDGRIYLLDKIAGWGNYPVLIFEISSNPLKIEQVGAAANTTESNIHFGSKIWWASENILNQQGEQIFPNFNKSYLPLHESNEYFFNSVEYLENSSIRRSLIYRRTEVDTFMNGMQFYRFTDDQHWAYAFDEDENTIYRYNKDEGLEKLFSMNTQSYYIQPSEAAFNNMKFYLPVFGSPGTHNDPQRLSIIAVPNGYLQDYTEKFEFAERIGMLGYINRQTDTMHVLTGYQGKAIYNGQVWKYDELRNPTLVIPNANDIYLSRDILHVECMVDHVLVRKVNGVYDTSIIDSTWVEYCYTDFPQTILSKKMEIAEVTDAGIKCNLDLRIDLSKVGNYGEKFRFSLVTITATPIPKIKYSSSMMLYEVVTNIDDTETPLDYSLSSNYPNPFNPSTRMEFSLPEESDVKISVYNLTGEMLFTAAEGNYKSGSHEVSINMSDYSSGVYFVRMIAGDKVFTNKIMLLK